MCNPCGRIQALERRSVLNIHSLVTLWFLSHGEQTLVCLIYSPFLKPEIVLMTKTLYVINQSSLIEIASYESSAAILPAEETVSAIGSISFSFLGDVEHLKQ